MSEVRVATVGDIELLVRTITLAFEHDPVWSPAMAPTEGRSDRRPDIWRCYLLGALRYPWTWTADDATAASVWVPPGGTEMSSEQEDGLDALIDVALGARADDYHETMARFDAAHPRSEPHYYLSLLATHPEHRGHGIGMALLAANLAVIDRTGMPAYLESTNPANDRRYASVGFERHGSFVVPYEDRVVTTMWRPPRSGS